MVTVMRVERRSEVLTPSSLACLSHMPTINLTSRADTPRPCPGRHPASAATGVRPRACVALEVYTRGVTFRGGTRPADPSGPG